MYSGHYTMSFFRGQCFNFRKIWYDQLRLLSLSQIFMWKNKNHNVPLWQYHILNSLISYCEGKWFLGQNSMLVGSSEGSATTLSSRTWWMGTSCNVFSRQSLCGKCMWRRHHTNLGCWKREMLQGSCGESINQFTAIYHHTFFHVIHKQNRSVMDSKLGRLWNIFWSKSLQDLTISWHLCNSFHRSL